MAYNIGDRVTWRSGAKTKSGTVILVVPPNMAIRRLVDTCADLSERDYDFGSLAYGYHRPTESYLVAVSVVTATGKTKRRQTLYWPRVSWLRKYQEPV